MCINWVWPILLLRVYFFTVDKVVSDRSIVGSWKHWALRVLILLVVHCHWMTNSNSVRMIIHLENFLLLSSQVLVLTVSLIHDGKPHCAWYKYVLATCLIWRLNTAISCHKVVLMRSLRILLLLKWLKVVRWSILVRVICNVSATWWSSFWLCS